MKKILIIIGAGFLTVLILILFNALQMTSRQMSVPEVSFPEMNEELAARHLAEAVRFRTVSYQDTNQFPHEEYEEFHSFLEETFPGVAAHLTKEIVNNYSLLYTWQGKSTDLKPVLFMGHMDVVPVENLTDGEWRYPAFLGKMTDGFVWGRGTMDDKMSLTAVLEAIEMLLKEGFQPKRTIYLAFGHDEEIGGNQGAAKIAALLRQRNIVLDMVMDEGGFVMDGLLQDVKNPIAFVGIAEKGYLSLEFSVAGKGGHSSVPPKETSIGILSRAIYRLESHPFEAELNGPLHELLNYLAPHMPFTKRIVLANLWLFKRIVRHHLTAEPLTNAFIRTSIAPTMLEGSIKENVLPSRPKAVVNFRILPGESTQSVEARVTQVIADPRVHIQALPIKSEPSRLSDTNSIFFKSIQKTISQLDPDLIVSPWLVVGATDSRHYADLTDHIYRFSFLRVTPKDVHRLHGTNERIAIDNYIEYIHFYRQLILNLN